ncbi:MAG: hypothetical protein LBC56_01505 [Oscillospiraceae bacterium]|jgi:hypothetical protein|nr:hypothetical protein [Oscillospiraceae bacterium]
MKRKVSKRILAALLACVLLSALLSACGNSGTPASTGGGETPAASTDNGGTPAASTEDSNAAPAQKYVIGVIPFADTAAEQIEWNNYLQNYVAPQLNIDFKFIPAPGTDADAAVKGVEELKLAGCQGILGIVDTPAAIEKANELEMWYVRSGGLSTPTDYELVKELPYYLGTMGPSLEDEYDAGYSATKYFIENGSKEILVYAALLGLYIPSEMHIQRFNGIRDALVEAGAVYTEPESGSVVTGPGVGTFEPGTSGLNITTIYGLPGFEVLDASFNERFTQAVSGKAFDTVIMGAEGSQDVNTLLSGVGITGAKMSEVGAFTPISQASFEAGILQYLKGKYPSSMGPAVAGLINAIDGHADVVKNADGTGSRLQGPFWTATSLDEFKEKVALDDVTNPAFNKALIEKYIVRLNPEVTRESFAEFAGLGYDELKAAHN